jgi:hypothetical protein
MSDGSFPAGMLAEWERFFADVHPRLLPGQDSYAEVFSAATFFPLQRRRELEAMVRIARTAEPVTVMEVGADKAGGLYHWCMCLPSVRRVIACEVRGTPYAGLFEQAFPRIAFHWMPCSSREPNAVLSLTSWLMRSGCGIDVLFLDGEKAAFGADFATYRPLLSGRAVVFMHDVVDQPMKGVFDGLARTYLSELILDTSEATESLARQAEGEPPACSPEGWLRHWQGRSCGVGVLYVGRGKP